ncbi:rap guanine nucleotide exchange factor 4-like isoform X2 [Pomacea canaliculata]|uniref:rap guanine nucleotide exchange factor 4-like isoform X2 n=1 Tax=Pomacea canaliculata TaxID=400727 RepID=UPI000D729B18|nr:rap guanine nucleotide exchange factor 4-like isoform X2 [Pomacea canaliculata]
MQSGSDSGDKAAGKRSVVPLPVSAGLSSSSNMVVSWHARLDKRPSERTAEDLDVIHSKLKELKVLEKFHPFLLQQLCYYGFYECLEKGITLFRQGDVGTNWYTVLTGSLAVLTSDSTRPKVHQDGVMLCIVGPGTSFGEGILTGKPHSVTVVTKDTTELLRVELKDFKVLWEVSRNIASSPLTVLSSRNKQQMESAVTPLSALPCLSEDMRKLNCNQFVEPGDTIPNPAAPITTFPSEKVAHAAHVLRTVLMTSAPYMIRDRKFHLRTYRRCMVGSEMTDWLLSQNTLVQTRQQGVGMWQVLLEEGVLVHVCHEHQFKDKYLFYRFTTDDQGTGVTPSAADRKACEEQLQDTLLMLAKIGPDAMMRMILRKPGADRTFEEIEIIYEELLHISALSHLSCMVKRELASVIVFESHPKAGTVLFNQGDEGKSWYIILKGSVNVVIYGKGIVSTLQEGDDFGKLALVNDAPRAATIVLKEDNCHFLRVDKDDFNRILRDVEANTVRLKEHGQDVLLLEKIPVTVPTTGGSFHSQYKYSVMAGTPEKMFEYLLETLIDNKNTFLQDFLLTYVIFMSDESLCQAINNHYHAKSNQSSDQEAVDFILSHKKGVVQFVLEWYNVAGDAFLENPAITKFLKDLIQSLEEDMQIYPLLSMEHELLTNLTSYSKSTTSTGRPTKKKATHSLIISRKSSLKSQQGSEKKRPIKAKDENIFKVYCADHTYSTLRLPMDSTVKEIIIAARDKLCLGDDPVLCEVKSTGERIVFRDEDICITTSLSLNGRLFITPPEHLDALTPLPEQEGPSTGTSNTLEMMSTKELAYHMTCYDWELFSCIHEYELIYHVFGPSKFGRITANLDLFLRRFNEVQFWVVTEMLLVTNVSKRVQLLRKLIKLASHCKDFQNLHSFFAIVMGLSNIAVSRLSQTWEKLPGKLKKLFEEFETIMDPSRNHRVYRLTVAKMAPPIIPFMPLLMKDMTFTHDGNKTYFDNLVNFEKMHMIAQTLRTVGYCRSQPLQLDLPNTVKASADTKSYIRNLQVIDNQRVLTQLSHKLEPKKS